MHSSWNDDSLVPKKRKRGIIYLSTIPPYMNVTKVREIFGQYGELGRVFLQLEDKDKDKTTNKKKASKHFTEGWVEFKSKKIAKQVAAMLNNSQIGGRKRSKFYDHIWSIKYLPRFKWVHLSERLAYERAVHKQRLRTEISQAKREVNFVMQNIDRSERLQKRRKAMDTGDGNQAKYLFRQRETDSEIREKKPVANERKALANPDHDSEDRKEFLKKLFSSGV